MDKKIYDEEGLQMNGDTVAGWASPANFQRALIAAEHGDAQGVVNALTESEEA